MFGRRYFAFEVVVQLNVSPHGPVPRLAEYHSHERPKKTHAINLYHWLIHDTHQRFAGNGPRSNISRLQANSAIRISYWRNVVNDLFPVWSKNSILLKRRDIVRLVSRTPCRRYDAISL